MIPQVADQTECPAALLALVRPVYVSLYALVFAENGKRCTLRSARLNFARYLDVSQMFASITWRTVMTFLVYVQRRRCNKSLAKFGAFKRALAAVHPLVNIQVARMSKPLLTLLALVWPLDSMY